eukprot:1736401-Amphidinium_carterae.1
MCNPTARVLKAGRDDEMMSKQEQGCSLVLLFEVDERMARGVISQALQVFQEWLWTRPQSLLYTETIVRKAFLPIQTIPLPRQRYQNAVTRGRTSF